MEYNKKPNVLFTWPGTDSLRQYFDAELQDIAVPMFPETREPSDLIPLAAHADIIVGWAITESLLEAATKVRLVVIPAIGVERQIETLKKFPHITAVNSRGNAIPTAQHAVALLLAVSNFIPHFDRHMRKGLWRAENDQPSSLLLNDVPVGVLGAGTVGRGIIHRIKGFGPEILCCSRTGQPLTEFPDIPVLPVTQLNEFLSRIRILMVAVPATPKTNNMIDTEEISLLQKDGIIINVARGSVINEKALYDALDNRILMGAGIDVWYNYRPEPINGKRFPWTYPFHQLDNVVLSPHRGASPLQRPGRFDDVLENVRRFINNKPLLNVLDPEVGY